MTAKLLEITPAVDPDPRYDPETEPDDDIPDMSTPYWVERFSKIPLQRGRPKSNTPKAQVTLRLDTDMLAIFRATGPGWQGRMNEALRRAAGLA